MIGLKRSYRYTRRTGSAINDSMEAMMKTRPRVHRGLAVQKRENLLAEALITLCMLTLPQILTS